MASSSFLLFLSVMLLLLAHGNSSEITAEIYWKKLLPKTPISNSLRTYFPSELKDGRTSRINDRYAGYIKYRSSTTMEQIMNDPEIGVLFLQKDLKVGMKTKKLDLVHERTDDEPTILPLKAANAIPFSTSKISDILKRFNINPNSYEGSLVKKTLELCELEANKGETRFCATSLESMADFIRSQLKTDDVRLLTYSFTNKDEAHAKSQVYTVEEGMVELSYEVHPIVCHIMPYPYAVFYCHKTTTAKSYIVPLIGEDGTRVNAGAVCHVETSSWNPKHVTMLALGAKPGTSICHFLSRGNYVFLPNN